MLVKALEQLQQWYSLHCDGKWERNFGVKIDTIDNPGWKVFIDITDTELESKNFTKIKNLSDETNWIICQVEDNKFIGFGGPHNLAEIINIFISWTNEKTY